VTNAPDLSRRSGNLLLRVLEQSEPVIAAAVIDELPSDVGPALLTAGAFERHAASRAALATDDDGPRFVDLTWYPDRGAYGYFDAADGHVVLAPDAPARYCVNMHWWLARISVSLDLTNASHPTAIVPGHAWDIGDLWITRQRKIPVLFARRLHLNAPLRALRSALEKRAGRTGGLILTSSRNPLQTIMEDQSCQITPIFDVMTNDADGFVIDRALVLSPYVATKKTLIVTGPLDLSPDARRLVINGITTIDFKSDVHIAIIRHLVDGFHAGKRFRAIELLSNAKSGVGSLRRAFGTKKWAMLGKHLKSQDGLWGFDL
jgi:hypothetical protein